VLGVDLDNVLGATDDVVRELFASEHGVQLALADIVHFDYWRCGATREQSDAVFDLFHTEHCERVEPIIGAVDALQALRDDGWRVIVITARPEQAVAATAAWLDRVGFARDDVVHSKDKLAHAADLTAIVEDHRETAFGFAERGIQSILFDYPWNRATVDPPNVFRVRSWAEVRSRLKQVGRQGSSD
jgi:uncharacterized HAD superfamily protein